MSVPRPKGGGVGPGSPAPVDRRDNVAATQRAVRLLVVYLVVLGVLSLVLLLVGLRTPGGTSPGEQGYLLAFALVAVALGVAGVFLTLTPAPRAVEFGRDGVTVVGRWNRRTRFPPVEELDVRIVRRYPAGFLSREAVESIEVSDRAGHTRSYLVEAGLFLTQPRERSRP